MVKQKESYIMFFNFVTNIKYFNEWTKIKALEYACLCIQVHYIVWGFLLLLFSFYKNYFGKTHLVIQGNAFVLFFHEDKITLNHFWAISLQPIWCCFVPNFTAISMDIEYAQGMWNVEPSFGTTFMIYTIAI